MWQNGKSLLPLRKMSHTALTDHLVFGTYRRIDVIDENHEKELYKFMFDFATRRGIYVRRIGGMPDHVHILCDIPANLAVASFVQSIKTESSKFMRINDHFPSWTSWAEGYGAFSVSASSYESVRKYIMSQKQHHRRLSFASEYRAMLCEYGFADGILILGDE